MRALQGLAFVGVLALLIGLAVGKYDGAFRSGIPVTLKVDRVGTQLDPKADVKVRGLIVGSVTSISTDGDGATVALSLDPHMVNQIPADVTARLLPKTLFGQKYVSLVPPATPGPQRLAAGDVIDEDHSQSAREVEQVLDDLLPLLQDVRPQDLATTLGSLSQALQGRGTELGQTLVRLNTLTGGLTPALPDLQADITQVADFSENLSDAAPDLLNALSDLTVTSRTIVDQRDGLNQLLTSVTGASDDLRGFLDANGSNVIALASSSRPTLATLARYAPEFPCLFGQLVDLIPRVDAAFGKGTAEPGLHVTAEIVVNRGKYVPGEEPKYADNRGPRCYPILPLGPQYPPDGPFRDGTQPTPVPVGQPGADFASYGMIPSAYDMGVPNSPGERQVMAELVALRDGTTPNAVPAWSSMLLGPLYRGADVQVA
jgi:phospholipid/cholesterol/gamma-HCH transport system substrate-binding protein